MPVANARGLVYRCPICGAEVTVISDSLGEFTPVCCNVPMDLLPVKFVVYRCPVCGAEVTLLREGDGFEIPRCCCVDMVRLKV